MPFEDEGGLDWPITRKWFHIWLDWILVRMDRIVIKSFVFMDINVRVLALRQRRKSRSVRCLGVDLELIGIRERRSGKISSIRSWESSGWPGMEKWTRESRNRVICGIVDSLACAGVQGGISYRIICYCWLTRPFSALFGGIVNLKFNYAAGCT